MALIKIEGKTKFQGKTIIDGGPTAASTAEAYIAAVEAADGESLESGVAQAYTDFITGLWTDGTWSSLKAACIMAGARTLDGALVPLVGTAPTNNNFVSGDYNRETGLKGNASTKHLNSNRAANADPQNDSHFSVWVSTPSTTTGNFYLGSAQTTPTNVGNTISSTVTVSTRNILSSVANLGNPTGTGFAGVARSSSSGFNSRWVGINRNFSFASTTNTSSNFLIFSANLNGNPLNRTNGRLSFYSIGESLDLALLDTRVSNLMTAIEAAI
jgi:hypothetical protein